MDEKQENLIDTAAIENADSVDNAAIEPKAENKNEPKADERRFSQEEVNEIVRERLAKAKAKGDDELLKRLEALEQENKSMKIETAFTKTGISPDKKEDIIFYMKGKGVEISEETLANELVRHPHWKSAQSQAIQNEKPKEEPKPSNVSVKSVGSGSAVAPSKGDDNDARYRKLFGL